MRVLGLDWGEVKIGIAISDPLGITSQPLQFLKNDGQFKANLERLVLENKISTIILGNPKNMNGSLGPSAEKVKEFRIKLIDWLKIDVVLWDERLTTKLAQKNLSESNMSIKRKKELVDSLSACIMLQSYMDSNKNDRSI